MLGIAKAESRRLFRVADVEQNLAALHVWNSTFEIPDVIAFGDFVQSRQSLAVSLSISQQSPSWGAALRFPYPNGPKLREFVVLEAPDLALLRASAERIARPVERRLSRRAF